MNSNLTLIKNFQIQWSITDCCNLRCTHCYHEDDVTKTNLPLDKAMECLEKIKAFSLDLGRLYSTDIKLSFMISGGEPLFHPQCFGILTAIKEYGFNFSLLTNGTLIDDIAAQRLQELSPSYVQVSIDGCEKTHDSIRGNGSFIAAVKGLTNLRGYGHNTLISFTASKLNYKEFTDVAKLGQTLGVDRVWADRMIPFGRGANIQNELLSLTETSEFFKIMKNAKEEIEYESQGKTEIAMHRALQFRSGTGVPYACKAGISLLSVEPDGTVFPCRRMPFKVGNIFEQSLLDIYTNNDFLKDLRSPSNIDSNCSGCNYLRYCNGGLKCLSYAIYSDPSRQDPGCTRGKNHIQAAKEV